MPAFVPACARTLSVFEVFAREKQALSNSDIARFLDLPESSCSDLLYTLHQEGYMTRTAQTRRFYPTTRLLELATEIGGSDPLLDVGTEAVEMASQATGETTFAAKLDHGAATIVAAHEGRHSLRYILARGDRIALYASAMGKALVGCLTPEEAARELRVKRTRRLTETTFTDVAALEAQIAEQRERGWYQAVEEGTEGVDAIAVSGLVGRAPLSICIAGPSERMRRNHDKYLATLLELRSSVFADAAVATPTRRKPKAGA
jgi:DNA-binding IclR family transcriptional regulator